MRRFGTAWMPEMQRLMLWQRWQEGDSVAGIASYLARKRAVISSVLHESGGIAPRPRRRSKRALTPAEREEISRGVCLDVSLRAIAASIGRSCSTVSREVARNGGRQAYRSTAAEQRAAEQAVRPKLCKLRLNRGLCRAVATKLRARWSPQQISGWLRRTYSSPSMHVSHETIYKSLFIQARGVLKAELVKCLRSRKRIRSPSKKGERRGHLPDVVSI